MRPRPTTILGLAVLVALLAAPSAPARACEPDAPTSCCAAADVCRCCPAETPATTEPNPSLAVPASRSLPTVATPSCLCRDDRPDPAPTRPAAPSGSRPSDDRASSHADLPAPPTATGSPPSHAAATTRARPPDIPIYLRFASLRC